MCSQRVVSTIFWKFACQSVGVCHVSASVFYIAKRFTCVFVIVNANPTRKQLKKRQLLNLLESQLGHGEAMSFVVGLFPNRTSAWRSKFVILPPVDQSASCIGYCRVCIKDLRLLTYTSGEMDEYLDNELL